MRSFATLPRASPHSSYLHLISESLTSLKGSSSPLQSVPSESQEDTEDRRLVSSHSRTQHQMVWLAVFGNNDVTIRTVNVGGANCLIYSSGARLFGLIPSTIQYKNETRVNMQVFPSYFMHSPAGFSIQTNSAST